MSKHAYEEGLYRSAATTPLLLPPPLPPPPPFSYPGSEIGFTILRCPWKPGTSGLYARCTFFALYSTALRSRYAIFQRFFLFFFYENRNFHGSLRIIKEDIVYYRYRNALTLTSAKQDTREKERERERERKRERKKRKSIKNIYNL